MKTKIFLKGVILSLACALVLTTSYSFNVKKAKCLVTCNWTATTSAITQASFDNCNGLFGPISVSSGTSGGSLNHLGCSSLYITTYIGTTHPAGTVTIKKNGTVVLTHTLTVNQNVAFDDYFVAGCDDVFDISW